MDENPLKGEPGAFVFEGTKTAVSARNKAQEQAAQASLSAPPAGLKIETQPPSVAPPDECAPSVGSVGPQLECSSGQWMVLDAWSARLR